jgi:tetratricopeptide (TPR) repeat protein
MTRRASALFVALSAAILLASCAREGPAKSPSVLFVGLDGADWGLLDGYIAAGMMPNLAALAREGRTGTLTTIQPPLSPLVWTTMMTGVSPLEHGILDFTRFAPATRTLEPITSAERRVPAVWNMAGGRGKSVAVLGLWATWPAEPVRGLMVADRFLSFTSRDAQPPPAIVHPADRETWAREALAKAERSVDLAALRVYLPDLTEPEYAEAVARPDPYAHPVSALRRILVETRAYDDLARSWIAGKRPDLAVVYFQGTDTIGHVFAPWAPPRQPSVSAEDFARYSRVPERYFAEIDRLLGEYRKLAAQNGAVLMLASDHGFRWNEGRPEKLSSAAAATAGRWHREQGIYLLAGPGIAASPERAAGKVDQVCATLLALLGLPPGKELAGPPLPGAPTVEGEAVDYRAGYHPVTAPVTTVSTAPSGDDVEKLRALGYIGGKEPTRAPAGAASTRTPASFDNEGLLLRQAGRTAEAAAAFRNALALDPRSAAALWNLSDLLHAEGRDPDTSDALLVQALGAGLPEGAEQAAGRAIAYARAGQADRSLRLLDAAVAARPDDAKLLLLRGRYRLEGRRCREARDDFERSARLEGSDPLAHASLGLARLCLGDAPGAARALARSLELNPEQPEIRRALGELGPG